MNKLYGAAIFFFYFVKYPIVIYLAICYLYLEINQLLIMDILGVICIGLILKDIFMPHKKAGDKQ